MTIQKNKIYKSTYLRDSIYFNTFDEVKNYYEKPEAKDVDEINEMLIDEYEGMTAPFIEII